MPQRKENVEREARTKDIVEHVYNAGSSAFSAMRGFMPKLPANSRAMREFRMAQKELLLAAKAFIDNQIDFIDHLESISRSSGKKEQIRKVQVRQKK